MACDCQNCGDSCPCKKLAARYFKAYNFRDLKNLAESWGAKHPELVQRLNRALALTGEVVRKGPTLYSVDGGTGVYNIKVDPTGRGSSTCTCPDFAQRKIKCKHILACALVFAAEQGDVPMVPPASLPGDATDRSFHFDGKDYLVYYSPTGTGIKVLYVQDEELGVWLSKRELKNFIAKHQSEMDEAYTDSMLPTE